MLSNLFLGLKIFGVVLRQGTSYLPRVVSEFIHRRLYSPGPAPKNIVVVGASFAGYNAAKCLVNSIPSKYKVIVIEKNSHFQFTWALPRFSVLDGHDMKAFIPYGPYLRAPKDSYTWVKDSVEEIIPPEDPKAGGKIRLSSGEMIDYQYVVLATGSSASLPSRVGRAEKSDGIQALRQQQQKIANAKDIVVIGGGAAGIELASDAKDRYPEKNVTLIHSRKALLHDGFGPKIQNAIGKALTDLGVQLVLGEKPRVPTHETGDIELSDGAKVHYDCLVKCVGQRPNSSLLEFAAPSVFSKSGHLRVFPSLQIADENHPRIYAAGDVVDAGPIKNGRSSMEQGEHVAQNIVRAIKGKAQLEYRQKWWEGLTKLTTGLASSFAYIADGKAEWVIPSSVKIDLDTEGAWKLFGATPYDDPSEKK